MATRNKRSQVSDNQKGSQDQYQYQEPYNEDENNEEEDDEEDSQGSGEHRWNAAALDQMDFVCTFLDNEEDNLPEIFDPKTVHQQKSDNCKLCSAAFTSKMGFNKDRQKKHCKRCGAAVCGLCSSSPKRRLSKIDKQKYRVCDECDTLMSNVNFDQMYQNCLRQQDETLTEVKRNIAKRDVQVKQLTQRLEKYKTQFATKLMEISKEEARKRAELQDREEMLAEKLHDQELLKSQLSQIEETLASKEKEIEKMRTQREQMRQEKLNIEEKRMRRENELQEQQQKLYGMIGEEFENSFQENQVAEVDDVLDRHEWRDEDTDYDEGETPAQTQEQESPLNPQKKQFQKDYYESHELREDAEGGKKKKKRKGSEDEEESNY